VRVRVRVGVRRQRPGNLLAQPRALLVGVHPSIHEVGQREVGLETILHDEPDRVGRRAARAAAIAHVEGDDLEGLGLVRARARARARLC
jgi:hypothetical protein